MLFDRLRIVVRSDSLGLVVSLNSRNSCHSEKIENLAVSVDFRLIQNLLMLIIFIMSGWGPDLLFDMVYSLLTTHYSPLTYPSL